MERPVNCGQISVERRAAAAELRPKIRTTSDLTSPAERDLSLFDTFRRATLVRRATLRH
jgi:hypothetical protein